MRYRRLISAFSFVGVLIVLMLVPSFQSLAEASPAPTCPVGWPGNGTRAIALISDLHFGVGKQADNTWDPTEDFRWSDALQGFLDALSTCGNNQVDLVIAGDLLELWQPTDIVACKQSQGSDYGCTPNEMKQIAEVVVAAHQVDLAKLGMFAMKGTNRLIVIPGNHDAALLLDDIWSLVKSKINVEDPTRLIRVGKRVWVSNDGSVVAEHGHQIGTEVNSYSDWPTITATKNETSYVVRPWGEQFVQKLYNYIERNFPIIDNLVPESAGLRYYRENRGYVGSAKDFARFLKFNLLETSLSQKVKFLGGSESATDKPQWDLPKARALGYRLFADSLPVNDPTRHSLLMDQQQEWDDLRGQLTALANDARELPDNEVRALCDQIAIRASNAKESVSSCEKRKLGYLLESTLVPKDWILTSHLTQRWDEEKIKGVKYFIYGHTHIPEFDWRVKVKGIRSVEILNTGAFQRLIDETTFIEKTKGKEAADALGSLHLEDLPACYASVLVGYNDGKPNAQLKYWYQEEGKPTKPGKFVAPCDSLCGKLSKRCQSK